MLQLYPPYAITDLAHRHLEGRLPDGKPRRHHPLDPDGFLDAPASLQPDPVYTALRHVVTSGPIGKLRQWIDQRIEAREDRLPDSRFDDAGSTAHFSQPTEIRDPDIDDRPERRTAA